MKKTNRIIAVILLIFVLWWGYMTLHLPESTMEGEPGPKFFPTVILVIMALLSVVLFFSENGEKKFLPEEETEKEEKDVEEAREGVTQPATQTSLLSVLLFYAVFLGGIIATYYFGFIAGMIIALIVILKIIGWRLFPETILFSVAVTVIVYLLFDTLLKIPLPAGALL